MKNSKTSPRSLFVSNSCSPCGWVIALASLMASFSLHAQVLVTSDSNFENSGTLAPWGTNVFANTSVTLNTSGSAQSPFAPAGTQGAELTVSTGAVTAPKLTQLINSSYGNSTAFNLSFDFKVLGSYSGGDGVILARLYNTAWASNSYIDFTGSKSIIIGGTTVATNAFNFNTWYHVQLSIPSLMDANTGTVSANLGLTPFGGSATQYSATWSLAGGAEYTYLVFQTGFGAMAGSDIYVDNAYVYTAPEPSSYALVGIGISLLLAPRYIARKRRVRISSC